MPITPEEDAQINDELGIADESEVEAEESEDTGSEDSKDNQEADGDQPEQSSDEKPLWEERGFKSLDDMVKSYDNAQSLLARQGTELGELRKKVQPSEPPKSDNSEEELIEEPDPYDTEAMKKWAAQTVRLEMKKAEAEAKAEADAKTRQENALKQAQSFIEKHTELDEAQIREVGDFAKRNSIPNLEHAHTLWLIEKGEYQQEAAPPPKPKEKVGDLPKTLSDSGGKAGSDDVSHENMTAADWAKLPEETRQQILMDVPLPE